LVEQEQDCRSPHEAEDEGPPDDVTLDEEADGGVEVGSDVDDGQEGAEDQDRQNLFPTWSTYVVSSLQSR
jgi:hypothetical protein